MVDSNQQTNELNYQTISNTPVDWAAEREAHHRYAKQMQQIDVAKFIVSIITDQMKHATVNDGDVDDYEKAMDFLLAVLADK